MSVYPSPGTQTASHRTQISFRGRPPSELGEIQVRGSRTGRHRGTWHAHSDGRGASFLPAKPFRTGERVTVRTHLPIHSTSDGDFRFRTARKPGAVRVGESTTDTVEPGNQRRFRSRPDLAPPAVGVSLRVGGSSPGYVVVGPKPKAIGDAQSGPMIVDDSGGLVYFRPLGGERHATDVRVQHYRARPVLTWWQGTSRLGYGTGHFVIVDQSYRVVKRVQMGNGYEADLHEFAITPQNTALAISYPAVSADLSSVGGRRRGRAIDAVIQEIDIETGLVLFEWHSLGKVPLGDSYAPVHPSFRIPYDYLHHNSVALDADGDFLLSARDTWAVYKIDRQTGRIEWQLGGKRSDFKLERGASFAWQHDAQRRGDGAITIFDNAASPAVRKRSRAIVLSLDENAKTARLVAAYTHPADLLAATQGNLQTLPNGNVMIGWGSQRRFSEYAPDGRLLWDAHLAVGYDTYRAYRADWTGRPDTTPRAAGVERSGGRMDVYASWNGATEVAAWDVLAGASPDALQPVASAARTGFETTIPVGARARYVAVRAKDAAGAALGTSPARRVAE